MEHGFAAGPVAGWQLGARATPDEMLHPIVMLRHRPNALKELETTLMEVSTPGHPRYGQHLSRAEVARRFPPVEGAKEAVRAWLEEHGAQWSQVWESSDMVQSDVSVQVAEAMFATTFYHFHDATTGADVIRATAPYSVPAVVASKVYVIGDLVQLPGLRRPKQVAEMPATDANQPEGDWPRSCGSSCNDSFITPAVLAAAYKLPASTPASADAVAMTMAVAEFGSYYDQPPLNLFKTTCDLSYDVKVDRQIGTNYGGNCTSLFGILTCGEAYLDIQYIKAVAPSIPLTCVSSAQYSLLEWAQTLENLTDVPQVQSVSYGNDEIQQTSPAFMDSVNAQFMKLGTMGISVLVASGDQGVYGRTGPGNGTDGRFHPDFPASSPYVTAVGGTDFVTKSVVGPEKAWADSGGGFSDHFTTPAYQLQAVAGYMTAAAGKLPEAKNFNASGRGYPDVAALGGEQNAYCVAADIFGFPLFTGLSGTSASTPVVAGVIARVNVGRAAKGKAAMGFLNPFLYQNAGAFNDVTAGKNNGAGKEGFEAVKGWDPATGLGTPNYPLLEAAAMKASAGVEEVVI